MLERTFAHQQGRRIGLDWPLEGFAYTMRLPLAAVVAWAEVSGESG